MLLVLESIRTAAKTDIAVLILGPTGAGKEVAARAIHDLSRRQGRPFQAVSCAAVPDSLFEAEVFGHERGAFTGAHERRIGGSSWPTTARCSSMRSATSPWYRRPSCCACSNCARSSGWGQRRDQRRLPAHLGHEPSARAVCQRAPVPRGLYYRINAFTIRLPALKERAEDIPLLARHFLAKLCVAEGQPADARSSRPGTLSRLAAHRGREHPRADGHDFRAALSADGPVITEQHVGSSPSGQEGGAEAAVDRRVRPLADVERDHISGALRATGWNKKETARLLQISARRSTARFGPSSWPTAESPGREPSRNALYIGAVTVVGAVALAYSVTPSARMPFDPRYAIPFIPFDYRISCWPC